MYLRLDVEKTCWSWTLIKQNLSSLAIIVKSSVPIDILGNNINTVLTGPASTLVVPHYFFISSRYIPASISKLTSSTLRPSSPYVRKHFSIRDYCHNVSHQSYPDLQQGFWRCICQLCSKCIDCASWECKLCRVLFARPLRPITLTIRLRQLQVPSGSCSGSSLTYFVLDLVILFTNTLLGSFFS